MSTNISATPCPFCGELMTAPLKFCVGCGRAVTAEDLAHSGLKITKRGDAGSASGRFALSRKEYTFHRQMRNMFWTTSTVMVLVIGYYCTMRYVLHEHLPFKADVMLEQWATGGAGSGAGESAALQSPNQGGSNP